MNDLMAHKCPECGVLLVDNKAETAALYCPKCNKKDPLNDLFVVKGMKDLKGGGQ